MRVDRSGTRSAAIARGAVAILLASVTVRTVAADVIDTNRPGFSFTPNVAGEGTWQIETGLSHVRAGRDLREWSLPNAELRYGVGNDVEVFMLGINWISVDVGSVDASGIGDIGMGTKIALGRFREKLNSALLFLVSVPTGKDEFSLDRWDPALGFVWTYDGRIPLAGTARVSDRESGLDFVNALKLPLQINDRQLVFVEWEANIPERFSSFHWLNFGFQWLLTDDIQVDFAADLSLTEFGDDYRFGVGFSTRF